ncbi:hypothetical protein ACI3PL_26240, partial [Lacticaseibacillus paracasei]
GSYATQNYYGQGFYTTEAVDIAKGYTKKGRGGQPTMYRVTETQPVKLFDMEAPLDPATKRMLVEVSNGPGQGAGLVDVAINAEQ